MEPTTNTSISINAASAVALVCLLIGGGIMYGFLHFVGNNKASGAQVAYTAALENIPACRPEKITSTDDKSLITSLVSYDELTIPRLAALKAKLTSKDELILVTDEITRQTNEVKELKALYKTEYTEDYTPLEGSVYTAPDSYTMTTSDESNYMGMFRGSLEKIESDFYAFALASNNTGMKENAQAFMQYKKAAIAKLETLQ